MNAAEKQKKDLEDEKFSNLFRNADPDVQLVLSMPRRVYDSVLLISKGKKDFDLLYKFAQSASLAATFLRYGNIFVSMEDAKNNLRVDEITVYCGQFTVFVNYTIQSYNNFIKNVSSRIVEEAPNDTREQLFQNLIDTLDLQQIIYGDRPQLMHIICDRYASNQLLPFLYRKYGENSIIQQKPIHDNHEIFVVNNIICNSEHWLNEVRSFITILPALLSDYIIQSYSYRAKITNTYIFPITHDIDKLDKEDMYNALISIHRPIVQALQVNIDPNISDENYIREWTKHNMPKKLEILSQYHERFSKSSNRVIGFKTFNKHMRNIGFDDNKYEKGQNWTKLNGIII